MNKWVRIMLWLLIAGLAAAGPAAADRENVYSIKELGLKVTLPDDLAVITRDRTSHPEKELAERFDLGTSLEEMRASQVADQIYLIAFSADWSFIMTIQHVSGLRLSNVRDFREVDDERLKELMDQAADRSKWTEPGLEMYPETVLRTPAAVFYRLRTEYREESGRLKHNCLYMTVYNDRLMTVLFEGSSPEALAEQRPRQERIINSLVFDDQAEPSQ